MFSPVVLVSSEMMVVLSCWLGLNHYSSIYIKAILISWQAQKSGCTTQFLNRCHLNTRVNYCLCNLQFLCYWYFLQRALCSIQGTAAPGPSPQSLSLFWIILLIHCVTLIFALDTARRINNEEKIRHLSFHNSFILAVVRCPWPSEISVLSMLIIALKLLLTKSARKWSEILLWSFSVNKI